MSRKLRVLLWSPGGAGVHYHGPGTAAMRLYNAIPGDDLSVDLAYGAPVQRRDGRFDAYHMIQALNGGSFHQIRFIAASWLWLRRHARDYDVFHGLGGFELTVRPAWWAESLGLPAAVKITNSVRNLSDKPGWKSLLGIQRRRRKLLPRLSAVIALSDDIRNELVSYGVPDSRIVLIPNGVDTDEFHPPTPGERAALRQQLSWPDIPTIVFVGSIVRRKQPHLLIEAIKSLPQTHLVFIGPCKEVQYHSELRSMVEALGVERQISWVGHTPDVAPYYRAADIFVLPSSNEGMSNALLEAMASGLPTISTRVSGSTDIIENGRNGCLIDSNATSVRRAVEFYLENPDLMRKHGSEARQTVQRRFGAARIADLHVELFHRMASRAR